MFIQIFMGMYICVDADTRVHVRVNESQLARVHALVHVHRHAYLHLHAQTHVHVHSHEYLCMHMYIELHNFLYMISPGFAHAAGPFAYGLLRGCRWAKHPEVTGVAPDMRPGLASF